MEKNGKNLCCLNIIVFSFKSTLAVIIGFPLHFFIPQLPNYHITLMFDKTAALRLNLRSLKIIHILLLVENFSDFNTL